MSSSYPSITHISHSGRDRSSGSAGEVAGQLGQLVVAAGLRAAPAGARAARCRSACRAPRSGGRGSSGTLRSLRVNAGTSWTRRSISSLHARRRSTPSGMVLGSSTISAAHVHQLRGRLEVEEARVEPGQSVHGGSSSSPTIRWNVFSSLPTVRPISLGHGLSSADRSSPLR